MDIFFRSRIYCFYLIYPFSVKQVFFAKSRNSINYEHQGKGLYHKDIQKISLRGMYCPDTAARLIFSNYSKPINNFSFEKCLHVYKSDFHPNFPFSGTSKNWPEMCQKNSCKKHSKNSTNLSFVKFCNTKKT